MASCVCTHDANQTETRTWPARRTTRSRPSAAGTNGNGTPPATAAAKATADAKPDVNPTVEVVTGQPLPEDNGGNAAKPRRAKKAAGEPKPKRVSALDAAAQLLADADQPMRAKEMIETMAERGLWSSPNGKTPEATLYAAILREIKAKGDAARFRKIERGQFVHTGVQEG